MKSLVESPPRVTAVPSEPPSWNARKSRPGSSPSRRWLVILAAWEYFGRNVNPVFGSYPSAIAVAFWEMLKSGQIVTALFESMQVFRRRLSAPRSWSAFRSACSSDASAVVEAAIGVFITGAYAMPLVALVPLLVLWLGLGFAVKASVVFLMAVFPICINTWLGVKAVPKTLIEVGRSSSRRTSPSCAASSLPATIPYIMAGIRLAVGRGVVAMVIAEFFTAISGLGGIIINSANSFDTARMFVPVIVLMVLATALNAFVGYRAQPVAPWQAEIADNGGH